MKKPMSKLFFKVFFIWFFKRIWNKVSLLCIECSSGLAKISWILYICTSVFSTAICFLCHHSINKATNHSKWKSMKIYEHLLIGLFQKKKQTRGWGRTVEDRVEKVRACMQFFRRIANKGQKRAKYLKIWQKMYKIWECFEKGQSHACDYCTHETDRISYIYIYIYIYI